MPAERHLCRRREPPKPESGASGKRVAVSIDAEAVREMVVFAIETRKFSRWAAASDHLISQLNAKCLELLSYMLLRLHTALVE